MIIRPRGSRRAEYFPSTFIIQYSIFVIHPTRQVAEKTKFLCIETKKYEAYNHSPYIVFPVAFDS